MAKIFNRQSKTSFTPNEKNKGGVIKFGHDNQFPKHLTKLINNSPTHNACVSAIVDGIVGQGLITEQEGVLMANPTENLNEVFKKVARDYYTFGYFALEVIWSKDRQKVYLHHMDASYLRAKEKNVFGKVEGYYVSAEWMKYGDSLSKAGYLPCYNPDTKDVEPKQLFVYSPYNPTLEYYSLPKYVGGLNVIELDSEVNNFHTSNIKNGLAPSLAIITYTGADDETKMDIEQALRDQYAGSDNAGSLFYMDVESPDQKPEILPIPQNGSDGYYEALQERIEQQIITSHRITSPMILGIKTEGQLGGRDEMMDAYLLFQNIVIRPLQQDILSQLELLLCNNYGEDFTLGVKSVKIFDDGITEEDVVVSTESTDADSKELEDLNEK